MWSGFYKKPLKERQQQLRLMFPLLFGVPEGATRHSGEFPNGDTSGTTGDAAAIDPAPFPIDGLDPFLAENMIENCIG